MRRGITVREGSMGIAMRKKKGEDVAPEEAGPRHKGPELVEELPPFLAQVAVYRDRLRLAKAFTVGVTVVALVLIGLQEARFHGALAHYTNREILIVPGAVDFMRVRPNLLPDTSVYYFAEYIAEQVGTFTFLNVESKTTHLGEFFSPTFRAKFDAELRKNLRTWQELRVTEVFTPAPVTRFVLRKDAGGELHYIVDVRGQLDRYTNDTKLASTQEVMTLKFRTTRIQADKPWFFEVEEISRMSYDEWTRDNDARERLAMPAGGVAPAK
jgi:hypothetical protein